MKKEFLTYEYDDLQRLTAWKLNGDTEKYEFEWCLCGAQYKESYTYDDSLSNSQTLTWLNFTDKLGRTKKQYYPYTIASHSGDEYRSLLYNYDRVSRRTKYSDPVWGHTAADTSGWSGSIEPTDEEDWVNGEPVLYRYSERGGLDALGRAESEDLMSGSGEPYFVERDPIGRTTKVIYPNTDEGFPEYQYIYEYNDDGSLKQTALYSTSNAGSDTFGPQVYVVQYFYDDAGRLIRKRVVDNTTQENISTRYETEYEYDGMGRTTRERTLQYQAGTVDMEVVLRDVQTSYDLGDNPTEIKFYDKDGLAYTLTQTFAQGYQITDVFHSAAADVTVNTSGSFTYDTNNNLTGTKEFDAVRSSAQLAYRGNWTFTYDRVNRLKSYTNTNSSNVRGNNWYDSKGKVWQRWTDNTSTSQWDNTLKRFVYDGSQLVQEHDWTVIDNFGTWVYTYADINRDYQRHPGGMTQRQGTAASYTDYYMQNSANAIEYKTERDPASATIARDERTKDFDQLAGSTFANISNLATSNSFIEMYGGGTGGTQAGFDGLMQFGDRHMVAGFGRWLNLRGNNSQVVGYKGPLGTGRYIAGPSPKGRERPGDIWEPLLYMPPNNGDPKLPTPDLCCRKYYEESCDCFAENPNCDVEDCPGYKRMQGWFEFCCEEGQACLCEGNTPIIGDHCGPCECHGACGHDCGTTHCKWSFGFAGRCGWMANPKIYQDCGLSKQEWNFVCKRAQYCACKTYNDPTGKMGYMIDKDHISNQGITGPPAPIWRQVWGCIAEICRTGLIKGQPLEIKCPQSGWQCTPGLEGLTDPFTWPHYLIVCPDTQCRKRTIFHELFHLCGIRPETYQEGLEAKIGNYTTAAWYIQAECVGVGPC